MTDPREVTVSDAEVLAFDRSWMAALAQHGPEHPSIDLTRQALAAFLAARVPDAKAFGDDNRDEAHDAWVQSHNACRDKVLRGV